MVEVAPVDSAVQKSWNGLYKYRRIEMRYSSPFTEEIYINSSQKAFIVLTHFCDYCKKDAVDRYHCSGYHASMCEKIKNEIRKDWFCNCRESESEK